MPPLVGVEIPVINRSHTGGEKSSNKGKAPIRQAPNPRLYSNEPLPIKPSENAPKNAHIVGRILDISGVTYQLKIGDVEINDVGVDEILDYVSALDLEEYENRQFREEREVLAVVEAERERAKREKLDRMKERAKRKGVALSEDDIETNEETEGGEEVVGRHGRARPTYTHLFKKPHIGRPRKKDSATRELLSLSDGEEDEEISEDISEDESSNRPHMVRSTAPLAELPKRGRPKRDKITVELLPASALKTKRQRRRRHPLTGQLMPVGWRYDPNNDHTYEKRRGGQSSPSFKRLSISQEQEAKRQRLDTESDMSRSPSPFPSKAELVAQLSSTKKSPSKALDRSTPSKNPVIDLLTSDDESTEVTTDAIRGLGFKPPPKPAQSLVGNRSVVKTSMLSSAAESSPEPRAKTSITRPSASRIARATSRDTPQKTTPRRSQEAKTSILHPSAGRASSTDPLIRPSEDDESGDEVEDEEWFIEGILAHHWSDPKTHPPALGEEPVMLYQVKWEGYDKPTW